MRVDTHLDAKYIDNLGIMLNNAEKGSIKISIDEQIQLKLLNNSIINNLKYTFF